MYSILTHSHSGLRYVALLLLVALIINSLSGVIRKSDYTALTRRLSFFTMLSMHIQLILGLVLFFMSSKVLFESGIMKSTLLRFFTVEHPLMMIIAIVLISIGHIKAKKINGITSQKTLLIYSLVGFVILMAGIPWPFREALGVAWF